MTETITPCERTIDRRLAAIDLQKSGQKRVRPMTRRELAASLGCPRNRVASIEKTALAKFAKAFAEMGVHNINDLL